MARYLCQGTCDKLEDGARGNKREEADAVQEHGNDAAVHSVLLVVDCVVSVSIRYDGGAEEVAGRNESAAAGQSFS